MISLFTSSYFILLCAVFAGTALLERLLIPRLRRFAEQPILMDGPAWHVAKSGTPTMGGIGFIGGVTVAFFAYIWWAVVSGNDSELSGKIAVFLFALACGAVGLTDDLQKLRHRQNKGLTAPQKFFLQLLFAALFLGISTGCGLIDQRVALGTFSFDLGGFYYPLALLFLVGIVNAFNLTDGLDGLLSTVTAVIAAFFILKGKADADGILLFTGALLLGSALGFLLYNAHPAKVFMGDTGSLFLGGLVAGAGILSKAPGTVLLACGVPVLETGSVILQVLYFKMTGGKRLFRMAPVHHHFEKCGFGEYAVVALFTGVGILFAVLAFFWR